jgi:TonB family protein
MLWIGLAAQMSAPEPQFMWFSNDDTPIPELGGHDYRQVRLRLTIGPDGRVHRCEIAQSSGNPRLDAYTCDLTRKRAAFRPARSSQGTPIYGVFRIPVTWAARAVAPHIAGDTTITLNPSPRGLRLPKVVPVIFAVDGDGRSSACAAEPPPFPGVKPSDPALVSIVCDQLLKTYSPGAAIDDDGRPVESVQSAQVLITKD